MEQLKSTFNNVTETLKGNETFAFIYDNPNVFRGTGSVTYGDEKNVALLLAGVINNLSVEAKEDLFTHLVIDDPETYLATALSYIDAQEK